MDPLLTDIATSIGAGGIAALAFLRWLGERIISNQLEKSTEKLKFKIDSEFDRIAKIHQKEFEVLPELWTLLLRAIGDLKYLTMPVKEYPDLNIFSHEELIDYLSSKKITQTDIDSIISSRDRARAFYPIAQMVALNSVNTAVNNFHNYFLYNSIFLTQEIFNLFKAIDSSITDAYLNCKTEIHSQLPAGTIFRSATDAIYANMEEIKDEIHVKIQERLHFNSAK